MLHRALIWRKIFGWKSVLSIAALAGASMLVSVAARSEDAKSTPPDSSLIAKGEYLARAGDCIACHTAPEGKLFAGGLADADSVRDALHIQYHARSRDRASEHGPRTSSTR